MHDLFLLRRPFAFPSLVRFLCKLCFRIGTRRNSEEVEEGTHIRILRGLAQAPLPLSRFLEELGGKNASALHQNPGRELATKERSVGQVARAFKLARRTRLAEKTHSSVSGSEDFGANHDQLAAVSGRWLDVLDPPDNVILSGRRANSPWRLRRPLFLCAVILLTEIPRADRSSLHRARSGRGSFGRRWHGCS